MLDRLPDEILSYIFTFITNDIPQLIQTSQVSTRYYRLLQNPKLWYLAFQYKYPNWSRQVTYTSGTHCLIEWKDFVLHLIKQQKSSTELSFEFVQEQYNMSRKRKRHEEEEQQQQLSLLDEEEQQQPQQQQQQQGAFWIQDPLVVDIDRKSNTGMVATGKHRKASSNNVFNARSEHKILFWEYPSWKLIRVFELQLQPSTLTCQIISLQTVRMHNNTKARFFSLAVGITLINEIETDNEDRADIWKSLFIYRLFDNGDTQCMAHIKIDDLFLGREVFLFSDASWCQSNDGDDYEPIGNNNLKDWMQVVLPEHQDFDPQYTVFVLAMGPIYQHITGCVQIAKFDIRGQSNILDPSKTSTTWDTRTHQLVSLVEYRTNTAKSIPVRRSPDNPTEMLTSIHLGDHVSCMIHFKYPPSLNHLICTGSSMDDELSVYDWRFGLKVGSLPWKSIQLHTHIPPIEEEDFSNIIRQQNIPQQDEEMHFETAAVDVKPWGLEATLVIPPFWSSPYTTNDLTQNGLRLIAVGDNRAENVRDKLEIKVWDISYLLSVNWDPFKQDTTDNNFILNDHANNYFAQRFSWWPRRTRELTKLALCMLQSNHYKKDNQHATTTQLLPYSPPIGAQSILLSHTFDRDDEASVKYTAYNVLHTFLFLLTEEGKVTVMDIETGEITGTVENIAQNQKDVANVIGIDVSVIGGKEIVVTSKEGLLRGIVL